MYLAPGAQAQIPSQIWHQTYTAPGAQQWNNYTRTDGADPGGLVADSAGNIYCEYDGHDGYLHLIKKHPDGTPVFDIQTPFLFYLNGTLRSSFVYARGVELSSSMPQLVYALAQDATQRYPSVWIMAYTTDGKAAWSKPFVYSKGTLTTDVFGSYADSDGNLFVAALVNGSNSKFAVWMIELDKTGQLVKETLNADILEPNAPWNEDLTVSQYHRRAIFDPLRHRWIINGLADDTGQNYRWGIYDPDTGAADFEQTALHQTPTPNSYIITTFEVTLLPSGYIGVSENRTTEPGWNAQLVYDHKFTVFSPTNTVYWHYPSNGYESGTALGLAQYSHSTVLYSPGAVFNTQPGSSTVPVSNFLEKLGWSGLVWRRENQPTSFVFPTADGFISVWNKCSSSDPNHLFLEHYNAVSDTYDWGKSYLGASWPNGQSGNTPSYLDQFCWTPYGFAAAVENFNANPAPFALDSFIFGPAPLAPLAASSVNEGQPLQITIRLTSNAPPAGTAVSLVASSYAVLMPNGTRAQRFVVPGGQSSLVVNATANMVTANTNVTISEMLAGLTRSAVTTVINVN